MRMTSFLTSSCKALALAAALSLSATAFAVPQAFNYQALITNNAGAPATTTNLTVKIDLYNAPAAGTLLKTQTFTSLDMTGTGGYVNLPVDATALDLSGDIYAELTVTDVAAAGPAETLSPRQKINSVPFALKAGSVDSPTTAGALLGGWGNRVVFVNPDSAAAVASPDGSITAPYKDINAAVAKAKTAPGISYNNRVVVMLMPGTHTVTAPIVLDVQGLDLVGFGEKSAVVTGTANPLIDAIAVGNTGSSVRNLLIQVPTNSGNTALSIIDGRVENCVISEAGGDINSLPPNLVRVATTKDTSFSKIEIIGDVTITGVGNQTTFNNGYILGTINATYAPTSLESRLVLSNLTGIGGLNFDGTASALTPNWAILAMGNVTVVPSATLGANTLLIAESVGFVQAGVPPTTYPLDDPGWGGILINTMADTSLWTGTIAKSTGNITVSGVTYNAFTYKQR